MTTPPLDLPAERITALRDIANAATEGPWTWNAAPVDTASGEGGESCIDAGTIGVTGDVYTDEDAEFIEAFDPPAVLALLDRVEAAERDLAAVTVSRDGWQPRAEAAEKKVAAVRELHAASPCEPECCLLDTCNECLNTHPCPTITALDTHTPETETTP